MSAFVDPSWTIAGTDGDVQERAGFLALVASGELVHTEMSSELVSVRVHDGVAVTRARGVSAGAWRGAPPARAQNQPEFFGLGDLSGGAVSSAATAVSADGLVVVGESESGSGTQAFRWTEGELMTTGKPVIR